MQPNYKCNCKHFQPPHTLVPIYYHDSDEQCLFGSCDEAAYLAVEQVCVCALQKRRSMSEGAWQSRGAKSSRQNNNGGVCTKEDRPNASHRQTNWTS